MNGRLRNPGRVNRKVPAIIIGTIYEKEAPHTTIAYDYDEEGNNDSKASSPEEKRPNVSSPAAKVHFGSVSRSRKNGKTAVAPSAQVPSVAATAPKDDDYENSIGPTKEDLILWNDHLQMCITVNELRDFIEPNEKEQAKMYQDLEKMSSNPEATMFRKIMVQMILASILVYNNPLPPYQERLRLAQEELKLCRGIFRQVKEFDHIKGLVQEDKHAWNSLEVRFGHLLGLVQVAQEFRSERVELLNAWSKTFQTLGEIQKEEQLEPRFYNMRDILNNALESTRTVGLYNLDCPCDGCITVAKDSRLSNSKTKSRDGPSNVLKDESNIDNSNKVKEVVLPQPRIDNKPAGNTSIIHDFKDYNKEEANSAISQQLESDNKIIADSVINLPPRNENQTAQNLSRIRDPVFDDLMKSASSAEQRYSVSRDYFVRRVMEFQGHPSETMISHFCSWDSKELSALFANKLRFMDMVSELTWMMADPDEGDDSLGLY